MKFDTMVKLPIYIINKLVDLINHPPEQEPHVKLRTKLINKIASFADSKVYQACLQQLELVITDHTNCTK